MTMTLAILGIVISGALGIETRGLQTKGPLQCPDLPVNPDHQYRLFADAVREIFHNPVILMKPEYSLSWIERKKETFAVLAERIHILYNPPREYFTLGIPVVIALLLVLGTFFAGFTFQGTEKAQQGESDKMKAYQELMAQMNSEENVTTSATTAKTSGTAMGLDEIIIFAVIIAITPYAIDITLQKRATRRKEELYTEFLFSLQNSCGAVLTQSSQ